MDEVFGRLERRLFELTGADEVDVDFREGGDHCLTFERRGTIRGTLTSVVPGVEVEMTWLVEGFRAVPDDSRVRIRVGAAHEGSRRSLTHEDIATAESATAKARAWDEILKALTSAD